jgi:hypothetical protein
MIAFPENLYNDIGMSLNVPVLVKNCPLLKTLFDDLGELDVDDDADFMLPDAILID